MKHILVQLMSQLTSLSPEEEVAIEKSFPLKSFKKGRWLLKQGAIAKNFYHLIEGCVREYELVDGEEKTTAFYTENETVANFKSLTHQIPSTKYLICNEDCLLAVGNPERERELYRRFPRFERFCRSGMEQMMGAKQEELSKRIIMKPKEQYEKLRRDRPDLLNRVPQYQIASYLGISPEALSRIRKRRHDK